MKKKVSLIRNTLASFPNHHRGYGPEISRRGFLIAGASLATIAALPIPALAHGNRYRSRGGSLKTELRVIRAEILIPQWEVVTYTDKRKVHFTKKLVDAFVVDTRTYEGTIPGPVLRVRRGDVLKIRQSNKIPSDSEPTGLPMTDVNIPHAFNVTNLHTHGFNVPPTCDPPLEDLEDLGLDLPEVCSDNVLVEIPPGKSLHYKYEIPDDHPDGTFWYHPHKHGSVGFQMMGGMGGAIVIEGPTDRSLRRVGVRKDKLFVIQQVRVKEDGTVQVNSFVDFIEPPLYTVNGELNPVIYIRPGEVQRWRFINAGMSEHVPLQLLNEDGDPQPLYQIAADGITFPNPEESELVFPGFFFEDKPAPAPGIFMAAGNRADVLIKCDEPGVYQLIKPEFDQGFPEGPVQQVPNPEAVDIPGQELPIATVICTGRRKRNHRLPYDLRSLSLPTPSLPNLAEIPDSEFDGKRRVLTFAVDLASFSDPFPKFLIGGRYKLDDGDKLVPRDDIKLPDGNIIPSAVPLPFDPMRVDKNDMPVVDQEIKEGAVEEWTIINFSPVDHPFHIHQVPFLVTKIFDPRPNGPGETTPNKWQDVQNIPGGGNSDFPGELILPGDPRFIPGSITFRIRFEGGVFKGRRSRDRFGGDVFNNGNDDGNGHGNDGKQSIAGQFVLHCHILDHEDTGMMQLVEVRKPIREG